VPPDSDAEVVGAAAEQAAAEGADALLAVGGGSVMDTAKLANVIFTHGGKPRDGEGYHGLPRADDGLGRPLDLAPLAGHVRRLVAGLGLPTRLSEVGVPETAVPALVEGAMGDACTLVNPREPSEEDFAALYERAP
jgi:alcohol dehydrogenase class IV